MAANCVMAAPTLCVQPQILARKDMFGFGQKIRNIQKYPDREYSPKLKNNAAGKNLNVLLFAKRGFPLVKQTIFCCC